MYALIQGIAMLAYVAIFFFYGKYYNFSRGKAVLHGLIAVMVDYTALLLLTWVESGFRNFGAQNAVRVFVFNPLFIYLIAKMLKIDFRNFCDFHAFPAMMWYGLGHLACIPQGCCHGFAYYEGTQMYNIAYALTGTNMLPNQLIESCGALLIGVVLLTVSIVKKFQTKGYMYYIMLILYGSQRFVMEFFRDNTKVIVFRDLKNADGQFGISNLALWAAAMFIVGLVLLIITVRKDKKAEQQAMLLQTQAA